MKTAKKTTTTTAAKTTKTKATKEPNVPCPKCGRDNHRPAATATCRSSAACDARRKAARAEAKADGAAK